MKGGYLKRMSEKKLEKLTEGGTKSIPASTFANIAQYKKTNGRGRRTRDSEGNVHLSILQAGVYAQHQLMQKANEITELKAEVKFWLNAEGGGQVGSHDVDIIYFHLTKKYWQFYNVKADYKGSIDGLSEWKRRHTLKQYPTMSYNGILYPVRYDFYLAEKLPNGEIQRVFRKESEYFKN